MRAAQGSVRFDKRRKTWNFLRYDAGKRRSKLIGTKQEYGDVVTDEMTTAGSKVAMTCV